MNPRKWFWVFFSAACLWLLLGMRILPYKFPAPDNPHALQRIHGGLHNIAGTLLWPVSRPIVALQGMIASVTPSGHEVSRRDDAEFVTLQNKYYKLLDDFNKNLETTRDLAQAGNFLKNIDPEKELLLADIRQVSMTMNACTVMINRGANDGVRVGMPVMCNFSLVGKIINVGSVSADVLLISDPHFDKIRAEIRRYNRDDQTFKVITTATVRGKGLNNLECDGIAKFYTYDNGGTILITRPEPGDHLVLIDSLGWPDRAKGYEFGVVTEVSEEQMSYKVKAVMSQDLQHPALPGPNPNEKFQGLRVLKIDR